MDHLNGSLLLGVIPIVIPGLPPDMEENSSDRSDAQEAPPKPRTDKIGTELTSDTPIDEPLPPDLQVALARYLGTDSVETLRQWTKSLRDVVGDGAITVDALCLASEQTPHRGVMGDQTYYFACFYDAVILAAIAGTPVYIRTVSPQGVDIRAKACGTDVLEVEHRESVFSFGIDRHVDSPGEAEPSIHTGYEAICPYVKAFPKVDAYHRWAGTVAAPTVALPLAGATELAAALSSNAPCDG